MGTVLYWCNPGERHSLLAHAKIPPKIRSKGLSEICSRTGRAGPRWVDRRRFIIRVAGGLAAAPSAVYLCVFPGQRFPRGTPRGPWHPQAPAGLLYRIDCTIVANSTARRAGLLHAVSIHLIASARCDQHRRGRNWEVGHYIARSEASSSQGSGRPCFARVGFHLLATGVRASSTCR